MKTPFFALGFIFLAALGLPEDDPINVSIKVLSRESFPEPTGIISVINGQGRIIQKRRNSGITPFYPWLFRLPAGEYTFRFETEGSFLTRSEISRVVLTTQSETKYTFRPLWDYPGMSNYGVKSRTIQIGTALVKVLYSVNGEIRDGNDSKMKFMRVDWHGLTISASEGNCNKVKKQCSLRGTIVADCGPNEWHGDEAELTESTFRILKQGTFIGSANRSTFGLRCSNARD